MKKYRPNGNKIFFYNKGKLMICTDTLEDISKEKGIPLDIVEDMNERNIYDLMDGQKFLKAVDGLYFIDDDGAIADVFVDGYKSNLGLSHKGICQGSFLVSGKEWDRICQSYKVEVNWVNK